MEGPPQGNWDQVLGFITAYPWISNLFLLSIALGLAL